MNDVIYLGVDIGGTRLKAGLVDENGAPLARLTVATPGDLSAFRGALGAVVRQLSSAEKWGAPGAVGVGCKGRINYATTEVESLPGDLRFLEGLRLAALIEDALGQSVPVAADNDARVALAGEIMWGAARGKRNVVMLTLGTGVGGAVLAEGNLLRGVAGVAGHLGHISVDPEGAVCVCGNRGCVETVFSARAIEAEAIHHIHRGCESVLTEEFAGRTEALTCHDVFRSAARGDFVARRIVDRATEKLGSVVAGLAHTFDPELVIIGGQISEAGDVIFDALSREVASRTKRLLRRELEIVPPGIDDRSGVAGAASLAILAGRREH